jgi:hypothetical protein
VVAPPVHLLAERDQLDIGDGFVLHVLLYRMPQVGPPPQDVVGKKCPVCLTPIGADQTIYRCAACGFGPAEWKHLNEQAAFSCEGVTGDDSGDRPVGPSTVCLSSLCSLAGDLAAVQVIRQALGLGEPLQDRIIEYYGYTSEMLVSPLKAAGPACHCDHETVIRTVEVPRPLGRTSLRDLTEAAGFDGADDDAGVAYAVDDMAFASLGQCVCGRNVPLRRFVRPQAAAGRCPACGRAVAPQPFFTEDPVPAPAVRGLLDRPLNRLGARHATGVLVRGGGRGVLFHNRLRRKVIR